MYITDETGDKIIKAVLVGLNTDKSTTEFERSMDELSDLTEALDIEVATVMTQNLPNPDSSTYIGSGKVQEIKAALDVFDVDIIIFNDSLSPIQARNLERELDTEVMDRTGLILQIFSRRARTREARIQVEYAQLQYTLPRLAHMNRKLTRQGGGSGRLSNKGAGEKQLELDRRHIEHRMTELRSELKNIEKERDTQRGRRQRSGMPRVSLVGYTNAGKSTLMNRLMKLYGASGREDKQVLEKDMLFATLDTSVRSIAPRGKRPFLLADTVGFISQLPHSLIKAFRSTIEEVKYADLILEVIDISDPEHQWHMEVTRDTFAEIGIVDIPIIYVFNKGDILRSEQEKEGRPLTEIPKIRDDRIYISARDDHCLEVLTDMILKKLSEKHSECVLRLQYPDSAILGQLQERGLVRNVEYLAEGILVTALLDEQDRGRLAEYICS
ncbi:MAG: GTPase HflX [Butyrivibrio sp.]|nr:GTPase HflX [Butyrivibrio sp.]